MPFRGPYIGGYLGAAWGDAKYDTDPGCVLGGSGGTFCIASPDPSVVNGTAVAASGTGRLSPVGFSGGVHVGYNWQTGLFVYGGEADFGAINLKASTASNGVFPFPFLGTQYTVTESVKADWLATIRGRLGVLVTPQVLLYVTGGAAFTKFEFSSAYSDNAIDVSFPGGTGSGSKSQFRTGWTVGGGAQWALTASWSIRAEYLYADFGSISVSVPVSNTAAFSQVVQVDASLTVQTARIGFSYQY